MSRSRGKAPPQEWWQERAMQRTLQNLLLVRAQRRYQLQLVPTPPLGATNPIRRVVHIHPTGIAYPGPADLRRIRFAPHAPQAFQMAMCRALIEHEAGHIVNSGHKPAGPLLGWLWNSLEDARQERIQATNHPELADAFAMLGDAIWLTQTPTAQILNGCLLYRWEWDRDPHERRFRPIGADAQLWATTILPLVEQAWAAPTSDAVTRIAQAILDRLGLDPQQQVPSDVPISICGCGAGDAHRPHRPMILPAMPTLPMAMLPVPAPKQPSQPTRDPFGADGHDPQHPEEADPTALQAKVAGYQRSVAAALQPIKPCTLPRQSASRGDLDLDRALTGHACPFDALLAPGPTKDIAVGLLIDLSASMSHNGIIPSVREVAMLVNGAAEIANILCVILGFDEQAEPILIRPLSRGRDVVAHRRIAGMVGKSGTRMAPVFQRSVQVLASAAAQLKLLIVLVDGDLSTSDTAAMRAALTTLPHGIVVLPCYVGADGQIIDQIRGLFGKVLDGTDLSSLRPKLCAWLRSIAR